MSPPGIKNISAEAGKSHLDGKCVPESILGVGLAHIVSTCDENTQGATRYIKKANKVAWRSLVA